MQHQVDAKTAQLDIRSLVSSQIALKDFFRCYLSRQQRVLLAHQRTRVAVTSDDGEATDAYGSDNDPIGNIDQESFAKAMRGFKPSSAYERKMMQGVLFRRGEITAPSSSL